MAASSSSNVGAPRDVPTTWSEDKKKLFDACIEKDNVSRQKNLFQIALKSLKKEHIGEFGAIEDISNEVRRKYRFERFEFYNKLLQITLGAEDRRYDDWTNEEIQFWGREFDTNLNKDSIFKFILDTIYEDEEIISKIYDVKIHRVNDKEKDKSKDRNSNYKWNCETFYWLYQSLESYRLHFSTPVLDVLKKSWGGTKDDQNHTSVLEEAKEVFREKLGSYGIRWEERSWRCRARLHLTLGRYKHAPISRREVHNFKNIDYVGPVGILIKKMLEDDVELLEGLGKDNLHFDYQKKKCHDERKLGHLKVCQVLSWASAANDYDLIATIVNYNFLYKKPQPECNYQWRRFGNEEYDNKWRKSWNEAWATALWNATYKGHEKIVMELLKCDFPYHDFYYEHFTSSNSLEPPLHVAVLKGYVLVVDVFCSKASKSFDCHGKNGYDHTPLEIATVMKKSKNSNHHDKKKYTQIQSILVERPEVKVIVEELDNQRQLTVDSTNAVLVGATLFASITFGGWLSPPLGYNLYYQFVEPSPAAPPNSYESYMSIQGHNTIQVFAIFNCLSFFFAVASMIAGIETIYSHQTIEDIYIRNTVEDLKYKLKLAMRMFIASVICSLVAFGSAGIAILPPIYEYQRNMYITIGIGGIVCLVFLYKMLWFCGLRRF